MHSEGQIEILVADSCLTGCSICLLWDSTRWSETSTWKNVGIVAGRNKSGNVHTNKTLRHIHVTIVAVNKQEALHILSVYL